MSDGSEIPANLPTVREWLSKWLGVQIPGLPAMPQTLKNADKAIGTVFLSLGGNLAARVDGNTGKVKAVAKIEIDDIVRNAEERRKLENRAAITKTALDEIKEDPGPADAEGEIEDDWLNSFARISEDKSSADLQRLLGKILAGEIRRPGSFSLRTLQFVSTLSREEAEAIASFFSYTLTGTYVPNFEEVGPDIETKILMEELGIATTPSTMGGLSMSTEVSANSQNITYGVGRAVQIQNATGEDVFFEFSSQVLSTPAKELYRIANPAPTKHEFMDKIAETIFQQLSAKHSNAIAADVLNVAIVDFETMSDGTYKTDLIYKLPKVC